MNIYFVSGLAANCKVFDSLTLPDGYKRNCIEWHIPDPDETIEEYARKMARHVNTEEPFILIGYSFGGIMIQEMNRFINPEKNIIIASIKDESELPPLYRLGRKIKFAQRFPFWSLTENKRIKEQLSYLIYGMKNSEESPYISYANPVYIQWSINQILNWKPSVKCRNIYHIHGTRDHVFPPRYIKDAILIKGGDHLMVIKRGKKISAVLQQIFLGDNKKL